MHHLVVSVGCVHCPSPFPLLSFFYLQALQTLSLFPHHIICGVPPGYLCGSTWGFLSHLVAVVICLIHVVAFCWVDLTSFLVSAFCGSFYMSINVFFFFLSKMSLQSPFSPYQTSSNLWCSRLEALGTVTLPLTIGTTCPTAVTELQRLLTLVHTFLGQYHCGQSCCSWWATNSTCHLEAVNPDLASLGVLSWGRGRWCRAGVVSHHPLWVYSDSWTVCGM